MSDILIRGMEMPKDIEPGLVIEFADGIDGKRYARLYHYRHGGLTEWLEAISTTDVRPVVRGKWENIGSEEQREYEEQVEAAQYCEMYEPSYDPETGAL